MSIETDDPQEPTHPPVRLAVAVSLAASLVLLSSCRPASRLENAEPIVRVIADPELETLLRPADQTLGSKLGSTPGGHIVYEATLAARQVGSRSTGSDSRVVAAHVRRAVWQRDGGRCAFVGRNGRRCSATGCLEFHHKRPYAAGGEATVDNIELRCAPTIAMRPSCSSEWSGRPLHHTT